MTMGGSGSKDDRRWGWVTPFVSEVTPAFRFGERSRELLDPAVDFHEGVGTGGEQALERDAEISVEHVALPLFGIVRIELIRGGNRIAALMLGKIHRGVGDLNQFLGRRSVERKSRDAKTGSHVLFAQQGSAQIHERSFAASWWLCSASVSGIRMTNSSPP